MRARFFTLLILTLSCVTVMSLTALAQEPETTEAPVLEQAETITPAVVAEEPPIEAPESPWTFRYFVPTGLVLGLLAVVVTVIQYFTRVVRTRYKTVE